MHLSYTRKFNPQDEVEMDLVSEMVAAQWRLHRIWLIQTTALDSQMDIMEDNSQAFTTMANETKIARAPFALRDHVPPHV